MMIKRGNGIYLSDQNECSYFGVGNYGLDQSFLRFKKLFPSNRTKVVVLMVVPETISRIVNVWKHYSEYGNTLGFKGKFIFDKEGLSWLDNPIDNVKKFDNINDQLLEIQKNDICYQKKFKKDVLTFPYLFSILKNVKRHVCLLYFLIRKKMSKPDNEAVVNKPWELVLKRNFDFTVSLFKNKRSSRFID